MPAQRGTSIEYCSCIVFGSRKSSRFIASATTIADLPSGEKYMLYGIVDRDRLAGLAGLRIDRASGCRCFVFSALFATHSVRRSHDGTTCCGLRPTLNLSTTCERRRIDHVDVVGLDVRHVDARQVAGDGRAQLARGRLAVQVGGVRHRRHAGHGRDWRRGAGGGCRCAALRDRGDSRRARAATATSALRRAGDGHECASRTFLT